MTVAPIDRAVDRKVIFYLFQTANGQIFERLYICLFLSWFVHDFSEQNFLSFLVFLQQDFKEFLGCKVLFLFVLKCWKIQKRESFGNWFWSWFQYLFGDFFQVFFFIPNTLFSHTWAIISILSLGSCFWWENWSLTYWDHQSCLWSLWSLRVVIFLCFALCLSF